MPPESHATDDDIIRNQIALQLAQYDAASKAFGFAAGASDSESSNENQAQAKYVKLRSSYVEDVSLIARAVLKVQSIEKSQA